MRIASACPVVPLQTSLYAGFFMCPPVYPETTLTTPSRRWKTASVHQKHPLAKIACLIIVSVL